MSTERHRKFVRMVINYGVLVSLEEIDEGIKFWLYES